jgi:hypothetical protein
MGSLMYVEAVEHAFGHEIDYAQLVKMYGQEPESEKRYSPAKSIGAKKHLVQDNPDISKFPTSYVEHHNLTMTMCMRGFIRLTNAFSYKLENDTLALALHFMHCNFALTHKTLANPYPRIPAMVAGLTDHIWTIHEVVTLSISQSISQSKL